MAIIQLEEGLAPSSSPAARLFFLSSIGFLTVCKKHRDFTVFFVYQLNYFAMKILSSQISERVGVPHMVMVSRSWETILSM